MGMMPVMDLSLGESHAATEFESSGSLKICNATDNLGSNVSDLSNMKRSHSILDSQSLVEEHRQDCDNGKGTLNGGNISILSKTEDLSLNSVAHNNSGDTLADNALGECGELYTQLLSDYLDIFEILDEEIRAAEARELEDIQNDLFEVEEDTHSTPMTGKDSMAAMGDVLLNDNDDIAETEGAVSKGGFERHPSRDVADEADCKVKMEFLSPEISGSELEQLSEVDEAVSNVVPSSGDHGIDPEKDVPQHSFETRELDEGKVNTTDDLTSADDNEPAKKDFEPLEDDEFNSGNFSGPIAFSGMLAYSGLISYSGQIPHSGNISLHSDSSTSTRSFAFPILASEWNSSPAKIGQSESRYCRRRRRWRPRFCCRRPATLFD